MKNKKLKFMLILQLVLFGISSLFSQFKLKEPITNNQKELLKKKINDFDKAPIFTLKSSNDSVYTLSELAGQVVLLNFWATWCGPCRMEIPEFNELYKTYHDKGFEILGISVSDNKSQLNNFTKSFKVKYPLLYGGSRDINKIMKAYGGVYAVPSSFLISKNGIIIWKYPGAILKDYDPQTFASLIYEIEGALKEEYATPKNLNEHKDLSKKKISE